MASQQKQEYATQQKTLRTKAAERTNTGSSSNKQQSLEHFEKFEVVSKTSFALLGSMAGELLNKNGRQLTGVLHGIPNKEYIDVAKELFEELCSTVDLPPSVLGQCINACDKMIIDSRPKKIKTKKIDAAAAEKLEGDNMGSDDDNDENRKQAGAPGSKRGPKGPLVDSDDDGQGEGGDNAGEELTEEQLKKIAEEEKKKREAEEKEAEAQRKAREEVERRQQMIEENEARLKAQARVVEAPTNMKMLKKDDDDDDLMAFANLGKGKKGGKGGKKK